MKNWDLINEFVNGDFKRDYKKVNNLHYQVYNYDNDIFSILFSYSTAIAVKRDDFFLINNNYYSQTTAVHYGTLRRILFSKNKNYLEMNFDLLYSAGVYPEGIKVLDSSLFYDDWGFLTEYFILFSASQALDESFFIYGKDTGLKTRNKDFICKLKEKVNDVEQALNSLNPIPIEERNGVLRQGEFFFKPIGTSTVLKNLINEKYVDKILTGKKIKSLKDYALEQKAFSDWQDFITYNHHKPAKLIVLKDNIIFCGGQVKHIRREHKVLRLQKNIWYQMIKNTAVQSWTASNKSD